MFIFIRKEEQIKKDEQLARVLQEKLEQGSCSSTTLPETRASDLTSQILGSGEQQGSEQVRRGQVRLSFTTFTYTVFINGRLAILKNLKRN